MGLLAAGAVAAVVGALVFEPGKLVVDERVQEAAPAVSAGAIGPVVLARGTLISHEHESSGAVTVLQLPNGSRVLRLEDLRTSNGPLLKANSACSVYTPAGAPTSTPTAAARMAQWCRTSSRSG